MKTEMMKAICAMLSVAAFAGHCCTNSASAGLIINELYTGGGSGNAVVLYKKDYIELFNTGASAIDLSGFSLDYASAAGSFSATNRFTLPTGTTIGANDYLLIAVGAVGAAGTELAADLTTTLLSMSAAAGKVRLVDATIAATSQVSSGTGVFDFVGYGPNASLFEGSGPAPVATNLDALTTSTSRNAAHVDTNNNAADFAFGAPTLTAASAVPEPATLTVLGLGLGSLALVLRRRA